MNRDKQEYCNAKDKSFFKQNENIYKYKYKELVSYIELKAEINPASFQYLDLLSYIKKIEETIRN